MKIFGIGTDIVNIKRIEKILIKQKKFFINKIFTKKELNQLNLQSKSLASSIAKKFAAKEAFAKAFGTGFGKDLSFKDIEIFNKKSGQPYIQTNKKKFSKFKYKLSLSDDYPWAIAFAIIIK
jgi:holo-[acyl-carrier protein] synthase